MNSIVKTQLWTITDVLVSTAIIGSLYLFWGMCPTTCYSQRVSSISRDLSSFLEDFNVLLFPCLYIMETCKGLGHLLLKFQLFFFFFFKEQFHTYIISIFKFQHKQYYNLLIVYACLN